MASVGEPRLDYLRTLKDPLLYLLTTRTIDLLIETITWGGKVMHSKRLFHHQPWRRTVAWIQAEPEDDCNR